MKKTLALLAGLLMVSTTAMAGGAASSSLSSVQSYDNPAIQGFQENEYVLQVGSETEKDTTPATVTSTDGALLATYDSFFIGAKGGSQPGVSLTEATVGWAWDTLSLAVYQTSVDFLGTTTSNTGGALVWKLGNTLYLGFMQNDNQSQIVGFAWKIEDKFRIDFGSSSATGSAGTKTMDIEYQWDNIVFGYTSNSGTTKDTVTYIAWEPEKDGITASVGVLGSDDPTFDSGTEIRVGYNF